MRKTAWLLVWLLIALALDSGAVTARQIRPAGKAVARDRQGHVVYQVRANGIDIGYQLLGSGPPLVMITGLGSTIERWPAKLVGALAKRHRLIILDNRGMGRSTTDETTFTYELFAKDVIGLLDALGVRTADVLGYSMGSTITQQLLLAHPDRVNKAIIHASSTDGSNVAAVLKGRAPDDPIIRRQIEATTHWRTPMDRLAAVTNQVMFVVGTADPVVGVESSKALAAAVPGAWLIQFKNGTHALMHEAPDAFATVVLTFLRTDATVKKQMGPAMAPRPGLTTP